MALTKKAFDKEDTLLALLGTGVVSVPLAMAWLGHSQSKLQNRIEKDTEFESQRKTIEMYDQAINSLDTKNIA